MLRNIITSLNFVFVLICTFRQNLLLVTLVLFIGFFLVFSDNANWETFKVAKNCKLVAEVKGEIFNTVGVSGIGKVVTGVRISSDKEGWVCNDGIIYYR